MTIFRIDFDWAAAAPGQPARGNCYRFSKGVRFFSKSCPFSREDVPVLERFIAEDGLRMGLKDVRVRIRQVSHQEPARNASARSSRSELH